MLSIKNLHVSVDQKTILAGASLDIAPETVHAIMGPNGSGKSSLAATIMGHPRYKITSGSIKYAGADITTLSPDKRARLGIFLCFQDPISIEGVPLKDFLRQAYNTLYAKDEKRLSIKEFARYLKVTSDLLNIDQTFLNRPINVGFSGGEKKRAEMLQLAILKPKIAILDEIDSGLDVDALKTICNTLNTVKKDNPRMSILIITHYKRILNYVRPDVVHILSQGAIVKTGGQELADLIEQEGYNPTILKAEK